MLHLLFPDLIILNGAFYWTESYLRTKKVLAWLRHTLHKYSDKHFIRNCFFVHIFCSSYLFGIKLCICCVLDIWYMSVFFVTILLIPQVTHGYMECGNSRATRWRQLPAQATFPKDSRPLCDWVGLRAVAQSSDKLLSPFCQHHVL